MAGSFGYDAETIDVSLAMGELSLLPAVRKAPADAIIVADGTSCRHQIHDGAGRDALHVARVLAMSLGLPLAHEPCSVISVADCWQRSAQPCPTSRAQECWTPVSPTSFTFRS